MNYFRVLYYLPLFVYFKVHPNSYLKEDIRYWYQNMDIYKPTHEWLQQIQLLRMPEFRTIMYYRLKTSSFNPLKKFYPGLVNLFITNDQRIGKGLLIQHGFSTIINCDEIGDYCQIWQGVTIGKAKSGKEQPKPKIGNNVKICCNAVIIGGISIGDNTVIGAGAVVRTDIPANCVVIGNPAKIVKRDGIKIN